MKPHDIAVRELKNAGYYLKRQGGKHDIYFCPENRCVIPLKRHDFDENDLRYIKKEIKHNAGG